MTEILNEEISGEDLCFLFKQTVKSLWREMSNKIQNKLNDGMH